MNGKHMLITLPLLAAAAAFLASCNPSGACSLTAQTPLTVYRLPEDTSDIFGVMGSGETYKILAVTADGWYGFDPGIAQAGNIGLAHHRWVQDPVGVSSSCLSSVTLVTLADVLADVAASGGG